MRRLSFVAGLCLVSSAHAGPHAEQVAQFGGPDALRQPAPISRGLQPLPDVPAPHRQELKVYGYQAYWDDDLSTVPWDTLTHLAVFAAEAETDGRLSNTSRWDEAAEAVAMAADYGVRVHLCVINFDTDELGTLLGSSSARARLIEEIEDWVDATGAHGVNIDFEGVPSSRRSEMVTFTRDLQAAVGEVVHATPSVDWSDAWDYAALSQYADLFIMGYGYHWSGSTNSGPTDPLYSGSGTPFSAPWSLSWTVDDYVSKGVDPSKILLGLPLYGYRYPVSDNAVPTENLGRGRSVFMAEGNAAAATHGGQVEPGTRSPYTYDGTDQIWYPSNASIWERIEYATSADLGGVGFWALHYDDDDPLLWEGVFSRTTSEVFFDTGLAGDSGGDTGDDVPVVDGDGGLKADASTDLAVTPNTLVTLDGTGSSGPAPLAYIWTQVAGPSVGLSDPYVAKPSFRPRKKGTYQFDLVVHHEGLVSEADQVTVVVGSQGCGCSGAPADAPGRALAWLVAALVMCRRRR